MEEDNKVDLMRKKIISELIVDGLFNSLKKMSNGKIEVESYRINEENMTYLIKKYDPEKFDAYEKMLLNDKKKNENNKTKKYYIFCDEQFERVAVSALKKVFSPTLFPRILANLKNDILIKNLEKFSGFQVIFQENSQKFANFTHSRCFDIGLFFKKIDDCGKEYLLKIYDGTGHIAGDFVTNIFDKLLSISYDDFSREKCLIFNEYEKLDRSKLLVQKF